MTMCPHIDVIATSISGSIKDWSKVERIVPLFSSHGEDDVSLYEVDSHQAAREKASELLTSGSRIIISAGGSGTFTGILEGCYDSGADLSDLRLGFLRKGSADLIGKTLGMPDEIEAAIDVFVHAIRTDTVVPCDVLLAGSGAKDIPDRHFIGYGGAELFGEIPHYTENRFMKYYKGLLGQLFGDKGPFMVGTMCAVLARIPRVARGKKTGWTITVDGAEAASGHFQALVLMNGDLGPDMPFAKSEPLGSGQFYLCAFRDIGFISLFQQLKRAFDTSIMDDPERWGFESFRISDSLELHPDHAGLFPLNCDGSTMNCSGFARIEMAGQIKLFSA
jgi:diacylglycerol kinase family enzyme